MHPLSQASHLVKFRTLLINGNRAGPPLSRNTSPPLHIFHLPTRTQMSCRQHVELILLLIHAAVGKPEDDTRDEGNDGDTAIVPDEMGVGSKRGEGLSQGSGKGSGEELNSLNEGTHVLGCLCKGILERGDGGENFGDSDEDVDAGDSPDRNGGLVVGVAGLVVAGGLVTVIY
jgi:hypothetical protein